MSSQVDFFISYTHADTDWAEWVDFHLKEAGYSTIVQFADFRAGQNIIHKMHTAIATSKHVLGILTPQYLESSFTAAEWMAALRADPLGEGRKLLFVKVEDCELAGLLPNIIYINLVGLEENAAVQRLLEEIQEFRACPTSAPRYPVGARKSPSFPPSLPAVWHVPVTRKPFFTGRDQLLGELATGFPSEATTQAVQILTGMGGAGKTRAAVEFCYQAIRDYGVIWWIDGSEERLLQQGLKQLGFELGLVRDDEDLSSEEISLRIENKLRGEARWLLVLDNVDEPATALRCIPRSPTGHILITSRNPSWRGCGTAIEVRPLKREDSVGFLCSRSGDHDQEAAANLSEELGDLPIALEQAAAFVERTGCGLRSYARRFVERRRHCQQFDDEAERAIAAVWDISIRRIFYEDPVAAVLARLLSFLGPHRIPLGMLETDRSIRLPLPFRLLCGAVRALLRKGNDSLSDRPLRSLSEPFSIGNTLEVLRRYALIEMNRTDVCFHPLVRSVVQSRVRRRVRPSAIRQCAELLSDNLNDVYRINEETKLWYLHALELAHQAGDSSTTDVALVHIALKAAEISATTGSGGPSKPSELIRQALRFARALPTQKRVVWEVPCLLKLVDACSNADEYPEATKCLREAIGILLKTRAPASWLIVSALSTYGDLLLADWETSHAARFYEAAISIERNQESKSLSLAALLSDYAEVLRVAGEFKEAESVAVEALSMATDLVGASHPIVARHRYRLGMVQGSKGDWPTAQRNLELALSATRDAVGEESPYLDPIRRELESWVDHPESRQMVAKIFQTPRKAGGFTLQNEPPHRIGEILLFVFEVASGLGLQNLREFVSRALLQSGLESKRAFSAGTSVSQMISGISAPPEDIGRVLSPVIVPTYRAIADNSKWLTENEFAALFRSEILDQYSGAFRRALAIHVASDSLVKFNDDSPSFEAWMSFFEANVPDFLQHIPRCFITLERALVDGHIAGSRRGIHGLALRYDAGFYLREFLSKAELSGAPKPVSV